MPPIRTTVARHGCPPRAPYFKVGHRFESAPGRDKKRTMFAKTRVQHTMLPNFEVGVEGGRGNRICCILAGKTNAMLPIMVVFKSRHGIDTVSFVSDCLVSFLFQACSRAAGIHDFCWFLLICFHFHWWHGIDTVSFVCGCLVSSWLYWLSLIFFHSHWFPLISIFCRPPLIFVGF